MKIGIDASNLNGGTLVNLINIISHLNIEETSLSSVIIFGSSKKLDQIPSRPWLIKSYQKYLDSNFIMVFFWKIWFLNFKAKNFCDLLYLPGANFSFAHPNVVAFQNQLPFDDNELSNFSLFSKTRIRMFFLKYLNIISLFNADGIIFLTNASKSELSKNYYFKIENFKIIPHGIHHFNQFTEKLNNGKFKLIYVSTIDAYKHHDNVINAVINLHNKGYDISLDLVGDVFDKNSFKNMNQAIKNSVNGFKFIKYYGKLTKEEIYNLYKQSNIGIMASSCETFSIILLEMMSAGLPIACSDIAVLKETLGEAGVYFNPYCIKSIEDSIEKLLISKELSNKISYSAYLKSKNYDWEFCALNTFKFLEDTYLEFQIKNN